MSYFVEISGKAVCECEYVRYLQVVLLRPGGKNDERKGGKHTCIGIAFKERTYSTSSNEENVLTATHQTLPFIFHLTG